MTEISKNVIKQIKKEKLKPYPKKYFILKKSVTWTLFGLSILLGIIASSVVIFQIKHTDWDLYHLLNYTLLSYVILILPYFWFAFLFFFLVVAYYYFRRTERGYRINTTIIILSSILLSIIGGLLLYQTGFSESLESVFQEKIPIYRMINYGRHRMWMSPQKGLLAGEIVKLASSQEIKVKDLQGNVWKIDISNTLWRGKLRPEIGLKIKLIGNKTGDNKFIASEIRPLFGRGYGRKHEIRGFWHKRRNQIP